MSGFMSNSNSVGSVFADSANLDAFGRLRVASPFTLFDSKLLHGKMPLYWDEEINGTASSVHVEEDANVVMSVAADEDFVIRQTKMRFNYQPGKSSAAVFTGSILPETGVTKIIGLADCQFAFPFNITNGMYFSSQDGYVAVNIAKAGSIITVAQNDWNIDKLNGQGPSQHDEDWSNVHIFQLDFEWLGAGRVRFGTYLGGVLYYVHEFTNTDIATVYTSTPNLPAHYEIRSSGGAGSMRHICTSVQSEGGFDPNGILDAYGTIGHVDANVSGTTYAILGIRLRPDRKDIVAIPLSFEVFTVNANIPFSWRVSYNPTTSSPLFYSDLPNSSIQGATGTTATTVSNDGHLIAQGYVSSQNRTTSVELRSAIIPGVSISGVPDELVISVTPIGNNLDVFASIQWREL